MKMATYVGDGGMIITGAEEKSRTLTKGVRVDLDEVILPASDTRPAQTLGQVVAADLHLFTLDEDTRRAERTRTARELPKPEADTV